MIRVVGAEVEWGTRECDQLETAARKQVSNFLSLPSTPLILLFRSLSSAWTIAVDFSFTGFQPWLGDVGIS